jgi:hypothetical protein
MQLFFQTVQLKIHLTGTGRQKIIRSSPSLNMRCWTSITKILYFYVLMGLWKKPPSLILTNLLDGDSGAAGWFPLASSLNRIRSSCRSNRMALSVAIYNVDTAIFRLLTLECGKCDRSRNLVTLTVCPATNTIGNLTEVHPTSRQGSI